MRQNHPTLYLLKWNLLMCLWINICSSVQLYDPIYNIICLTTFENNLSIPDDQIIKIVKNNTGKTFELKELRNDNSSYTMWIDLKNCTLRPGFFTFLNLSKLMFFTSRESNRNTVLLNESFIGGCTLENISFTDNDIEIIEPFAFSCLKYVLRIWLRNNKIKFLFAETFQKMKNLFYIDISNNYLQTLPEGIFDGLISLRVLILRSNAITFLPDAIFHDQQAILESLYLSGNYINYMNYSFLSNLTHLRNLDISSNNLKYLDYIYLRNKYLEALDLSKNKELVLHSGMFLGLYYLKELYLTGCNIVDLPKYVFQDTGELSQLGLSNNHLKTMNSDAFIHLEHLKTLDLSYNNITEIQSIDLLDGKFGILQINLEHNQVTKIDADLPVIHDAELRPRIHYYVTGNPFKCDCHAYKLYSYLKNASTRNIFFPNGLVCEYPKNFRQKELILLEPKDFICNISKYCPESCNCFHRVSDNTNTMNCSNRYYKYLPTEAPYNINILDISHNNLTSLSNLKKTIWENLTEVHAEYNQIVSTGLYLPRNVSILKLHCNNLKEIPDAIIKQAAIVKGIEITLANNSWQCDCSLRFFKKWISNHIGQVIDINDIYCIFSNNSMSTSSLIKLKETDICPDFLYIQYVITPVISVLFGLVLMIYYRYKIYILSCFYSHCNTCYMLFCCNRQIHEDKEFDCFISYCSEDREITMFILEEFEKKPPYYKFCIHERNWLPGRFITTNIVDSVQHSRKTLIIISKAFLKSEWFYLEFQAAYYQTLQDKTDRLILIVKGDFPSKEEVDSDVWHVISSKTYLEWGETWFWEKLGYAIYQQNVFTGHKKIFIFNRIINWFKKNDSSDQQEMLLREEA